MPHNATLDFECRVFANEIVSLIGNVIMPKKTEKYTGYRVKHKKL